MLELRPLGPADLEDVLAVYGDLAQFFTLLIGAPTVPRDYVVAEMTEGPTGHEKLFLGLYEHGRLVGVVDVLPCYPAAGSAWIGAFLLAESHQRRGLGRAGVALVEELVRGRGARTIALGVELVNERARAFWSACGYAVTGEQFDTDVLGHTLRAEVRKKQL